MGAFEEIQLHAVRVDCNVCFKLLREPLAFAGGQKLFGGSFRKLQNDGEALRKLFSFYEGKTERAQSFPG